MSEPHSLQDTVMQQRFRQIVADREVNVIVETGLDKGLSTVTLSKMVNLAIGIDNNLNAVAQAHNSLGMAGVTNAMLIADNSPDALRKLSKLLSGYSVLYFLDAHWQSYWPLLDEIAAISPGTGVIVLHDMQVPGHPELGCDSYDGKTLNYDYVKEALTKWSPKHRIEYNDHADCPIPRGVGYVFPR